jgi:hypothetical protein
MTIDVEPLWLKVTLAAEVPGLPQESKLSGEDVLVIVMPAPEGNVCVLELSDGRCIGVEGQFVPVHTRV